MTLKNEVSAVFTPMLRGAGTGADAARSCDSPWECMWRLTGPRGARYNMRVCADWMVMNGNACGSAAWTAADWGTGSASSADFWLLNNVDECGSVQKTPFVCAKFSYQKRHFAKIGSSGHTYKSTQKRWLLVAGPMRAFWVVRSRYQPCGR